MIKKIQHFTNQVFAVAAFRESMRDNDLVFARKHYLGFQGSKSPRHIAMGARLYLTERNFEKAKELLELALRTASQKKGRNNS